jgi:radical SAM superfamily enzyme YgiQ (UPF0313 family)
VRLLLLSTYELGHQPLGIAGPARVLGVAGHELRGRDLAVEQLHHDDLSWADAVVCSVPMHTALRLALGVLRSVRASRPEMPIALHGLYAPVGASALRDGDLAVAGDADGTLLDWASSIGDPATPESPHGPVVRVEIGRRGSLIRTARDAPGDRHATTVACASGDGRSAPVRDVGACGLPDRTVVPPLDRYTHLVGCGPDRLVGAVEASRGCSHRCRHCPVPTVYDGRTRAVPVEDVLADVAQLVAAGAEHIHLCDPDFLNRPQHASRVVAALHADFPGVSFDATVKVSHILAHGDVIAQMGASGCSFVVSAFESTSATVLERLDKGHTAAEAGEAVAVLRRAGIEPRPSFLPFTPWTSREDLVELMDFVARHDLVDSVDAVQYGIRLLLPPGSLLLRDPDPVLASALGDFDPDALGWTWRSPDPLLDTLQDAIAVETERAACHGWTPGEAYAVVRAAVFDMLGRADPGLPTVVSASGAMQRPRLSEAWFCCAEPTARQLGAVRDGMLTTSS